MSAFYRIIFEMKINLWLQYEVIYQAAARYRML